MLVALPVKCQNGHEATWYWELRGMTWSVIGVPDEQKCKCPKWSEGQGYRPAGDPEVIRPKKFESEAYALEIKP